MSDKVRSSPQCKENFKPSLNLTAYTRGTLLQVQLIAGFQQGAEVILVRVEGEPRAVRRGFAGLQAGVFVLAGQESEQLCCEGEAVHYIHSTTFHTTTCP